MLASIFKSKTRTILLSGFLAGTLDLLSAIVILAGGKVEGTFRYIAKGAIGQFAYRWNSEAILIGLISHYIISFTFAISYFLVYPHIPFLKKQKIISGLFFGLMVWTFMRYAILPHTFNPPGSFSPTSTWRNIMILMFVFGLPISLMTSKHYSQQEQSTEPT